MADSHKNLPGFAPGPAAPATAIDGTHRTSYQANTKRIKLSTGEDVNDKPRTTGPIRHPEFAGYPFLVMNLDRRPPRSRHAIQKETAQTRLLVQAMGHLQHIPLPSNLPFTKGESDLILHLKEDLQLGWNDIWSYFPHRSTAETVASRYHKYLQYVSKKRKTSASSSYQSSARSSRSTPQTPSEIQDSAACVSEANRRRSERLLAQGCNQPGRFEMTKWLEQNELEAEGIDELPSKNDHPYSTQDSRSHTSGRSRHGFGVSLSLSKIVTPVKVSTDSLHALELLEQRDLFATAAGAARVSWQKDSGAQGTVLIHKPYLTAFERSFITSQEDSWMFEGWPSTMLHAAFAPAERESIEDALLDYFQIPALDIDRTDILKELVHYLGDDEINRAAHHIITTTRFMGRSQESIEAFLKDIKEEGARFTSTLRLHVYPEQGRAQACQSINRCLRQRELRIDSTGLRSSTATLRYQHFQTYGAVKSFKEMSGDVNAIAWSPSGLQFAVGAAALTDVDNMQYNCCNNLLYGDTIFNKVFELPEHAISRETASELNPSHALLTTQDSLLFTTISAIDFSQDGQQMFTGGRDRYVRVWNTTSTRPFVRWCIPQAGVVELIVANSDIFAVGVEHKKWPVRIYKTLDQEDLQGDFNPNKMKMAKFMPSRKHLPTDTKVQLAPTALSWRAKDGGRPSHLLAGFAASDRSFGSGEVCVWDLEIGAHRPTTSVPTRAVFDAKWHPHAAGRVVVGCVPGSNVNRGIHSVVRIYDFTSSSTRSTLELECPAKDMNDVVMNNIDDSLVTVGCTDGKAYVWDVRKPDHILHTLAHGPPSTPRPIDVPLEESDTGVRFLSWGPGRTLYTGSSDGLIAKWNPYRAPQDALEDIVVELDSGVTSAHFSPDFSQLLVGEEMGCFHLLEAGRGRESKADAFNFVPANEQKNKMRQSFALTT